MNAPEKIYIQSARVSGSDILLAATGRRIVESDIEYTRSDFTGWRPIETAPKDGTDILLTNGKCVEEGHFIPADAPGYSGDEELAIWVDWNGGMSPLPTHWQPLPEPPKEGEQHGG